MESIAFKEWAIVCEALGRGVQSIILRKGGIAEGREGFSFRHRDFFLFPTFFHEQIEKTRLSDVTLPERREGEIELRFLAKLEIAKWITSPEIAESLEALHIFKPEVVRERFHNDNVAGLHVAFVRIFRLQPAWTVGDEKSFAGCRSWVDLPAPAAGLSFQSVLSESAHEHKKKQFLDCTKEVAALPSELQVRGS
jgi:hypothetical protein